MNFNTSMRKRQDLNACFTKEVIQMAMQYMKKVLGFISHQRNVNLNQNGATHPSEYLK